MPTVMVFVQPGLLSGENNELWGASISQTAQRGSPGATCDSSPCSPFSFPSPSSVFDDLKIECIPFLLSLLYSRAPDAHYNRVFLRPV